MLHPNHRQAKQDYFAYPWTVQTFRPTKALEFGYRQGQIKPPSAVTAPPFALYTSKELHPAKAGNLPPYSAPVKPVLAPLLSAKPSDRRLRRADRRRLAAPALTTVEEDVSPFDSISQVSPLRSFRPESLRLRTVDEPIMGRVESELRMNSRNRALSTPRPRPPLDADGFPQTPTRIFKGEYVDPSEYGFKKLIKVRICLLVIKYYHYFAICNRIFNGEYVDAGEYGFRKFKGPDQSIRY